MFFVFFHVSTFQIYAPLKVTLNDCLACSGCVTSAEVVLIEEQRPEELKSYICVVVPPAACSILTPKRIFYNAFLLDLIIYCLFIGWVCYAEKTQRENIVNLISHARSPQAVMGSIIKDYVGRKFVGYSADEIFHFTVMPCYDKKLEASRSNLTFEETTIPEVDCVLSTGIFSETDIKVDQYFHRHALYTLYFFSLCTWLQYPVDEFERYVGQQQTYFDTGSGGYADYVFRRFLNGYRSIHLSFCRNRDMTEFSLLAKDGHKLLKMALCYGFRNIQNIIRKINQGKCEYDFIEVMACPSGCLNGGGNYSAAETRKAMFAEVEKIYDKTNNPDPRASGDVAVVMTEWLEDLNSDKAKTRLYTDYHVIEKTTKKGFTFKW
ncbi:unnamed protein product [Soboliphyme baturini]|uniref:Fe_hyd_lg_C domain-containing protein n=1 Tax=Soboliphyme baturini TaxID=241478 RepID=A0A183IT41_9BILA|nr:unnamed protein product [Soboliphyme baturini]